MLKRGALLLGLLLAACPGGQPAGPDASVKKHDASLPPDAEPYIPDETDAGPLARGDGGAGTGISWCDLQFPASASIAVGSKVTVFGQVYVPGVTNASGAGSGVEGQVGYGGANTDGSKDTTWTWAAATFNKDSGNNDEYQADLAPAVGTYAYAYRFRYQGGAWTYCDQDGSADGFDATKQGSLTVTAVKPAAITWCSLAPASGSVKVGASLPVKGQVYAAGVTDAAGQGAGITAEVGYGPTGSDPRSATSWTWASAGFDQDSGNNDQYTASIAPAAAGSYAYAYRFTLGSADPVYCDTAGHDPASFDPSKLGALSVNLAGVDWCALQFPPSASVAKGAAVTVYGRVYVSGVTAGAGQGLNVDGQVGYGPQGSDGSTDASWIWSDATYEKDVDGVTAGDLGNDEYQADLNVDVGSYSYAYRFRYQGGAWTYCDLDSSANGYDKSNQGALTVNPVVPPAITWCDIAAPTSASIQLGQSATIFGKVFAAGITDSAGQGAGVVGQLAFGAAGSDPRGWPDASWVSASYDTDDGANNDQYQGQLAPTAPGSYAYAWRFRLGTGDAVYCDTVGHDPANFDSTALGSLQVKALSVDWCNLQFPPSASLTLGGSLTAYGWVLVTGVTDQTGAGAGVEGQLGVGSAGSDGSADATWTWTPAAYNADVGSNDEYQATVTPSASGSFAYAYRFRYKGGPWTYCDLDGSDGGYSAAQQGALTVSQAKPPAVDWCELKFPASASLTTGDKLTVYGEAYVAGVTDGAGAGAGVEGQLGIGSAGSDGSSDTTWTWAAATYASDDGSSNDEYQADLAPTAAGAYAYAFRFRYQGGAWTYCDLTGSADGYDKTQQGALTVAAVKASTVDWCNLQWPPAGTITKGGAVTVYGRVFVNGVTGLVGQGADIKGQLGYGAAGSDGSSDATWTWTDAAWSGDVDGMVAGDHANDEYVLALSPDVGSYAYAWRFSYKGGPWTYCDLDGSGDGFDKSQQGSLTVNAAPLPTIDYCVLQWPPSGSVVAGTALAVYGQVLKTGVTDKAGQGALVDAQLGYGAAGTDGSIDTSWTWVTASYNVDVGSNDEYQANLAPAPGNYSYAYRFRYSGGGWSYCDLDSSTNGFSKAQEGALTVTAATAPWVLLHALVSPVENTGAQLLVSGEVYLAGVTDKAGQGAGFTVDVGIGARGSAPTDASWTWTAAAYRGDADGGGTLFNDVWGGWITAPAAGSYDVAMRFKYNGQTYYADLDGSQATYQSSQADQLQTFAVGAPSQDGINWCNVQWPPSTSAAPGVTTEPIYGQVYIAGVTTNPGSVTGLVAQLGLGADGSDANTAQWTWTDAAFNVDSNHNAEYAATLVAPATAGTYRYVYRFRYLSGWVYCETAGVDDTHPFDPTTAGTLTVK